MLPRFVPQSFPFCFFFFFSGSCLDLVFFFFGLFDLAIIDRWRCVLHSAFCVCFSVSGCLVFLGGGVALVEPFSGKTHSRVGQKEMGGGADWQVCGLVKTLIEKFFATAVAC